VHGLLARWTDANNHLRLEISYTSGFIQLFLWDLVKVVTGTPATIASGAFHLPRSARLLTYDSGFVVIQGIDTAGAVTTWKLSDSSLATAGALASGKGGIADKGANTSTRTYDNVTVSTPTTEPIALYSGRKLQVRFDSTERESSAGGTWGRPQTYRGSRFYVQPAGTADRTTRVAVKASRNDLTTAEDANLTDQIALKVTVTPRCTVIPR
jgi:hypothetical protein